MKAFLTVGTQLPFDRLVRAMDAWTGENPSAEVFAQIGPSRLCPANMSCRSFIGAAECKARVEEADFVVAHAGMGSIISALEAVKPIIVMPRRASLGEHRNEHQIATVAKLRSLPRVYAIDSEEELATAIDQVMERISARQQNEATAERIGPSGRLLTVLRSFVAVPTPAALLDPVTDAAFENLAGTASGQLAGMMQRR